MEMGRDGSPRTPTPRDRGGGRPHSWSRRSGGRRRLDLRRRALRTMDRDPPRSSERTPPTAVFALSVLILSLFAGEGVAFGNPPLPGRLAQGATRNPRAGPFRAPQPASTSLSYKNNSPKQDVSSPAPRRSRVRLSKKDYKARRGNAPGPRSYRGVPATEEELAHHVQAVHSGWHELGAGGTGDAGGGACAAPSSPSARQRHLDSCRKLDRHPALVLNADYQPLRMLPLSICSWQDSVKAVLSGKAVAVDVYPQVFARAVSLEMPVPSVIALLEYAPTGNAKPAFTRRNVFLRDGYRCQYCSKLFRTSDLSLDHVIPRSMGGKLNWDNTVTCCNKCNARKGCLRPHELHRVGMELQSQPRRPSLYDLAAGAAHFVPRRVHPTWAPFLGFAAVGE